jgi:uncharacterized repeat protein (TIGR01451 family)
VPPASGSFNVVVNVASTVPSGTVLLNIATITDAQGLIATDEVTVPVVSRADVIVDKSASPSPVFAGETLTYSIVVSNAGPSEAQSVVLTDVLPLERKLRHRRQQHYRGMAVAGVERAAAHYAHRHREQRSAGRREPHQHGLRDEHHARPERRQQRR